MRIRDIEILLAVARIGSFSKAALELGISQPAVSQAVKRVEDDLDTGLFTRNGYAVELTTRGEVIAKSLDRIIQITDGLRFKRDAKICLRIGLSPLLGGREATMLIGETIKAHEQPLEVEFLDSADMVMRHDLDIRVALPTHQRRAPAFVDLPTAWIGAANGIFIRSRKEAEVWSLAHQALMHCDVPVRNIIDVNDCGQAYHMAAAGAGFTPCVMTRHNAFQANVLCGLPSLGNVRLDIFAEPSVAQALRDHLASDDDMATTNKDPRYSLELGDACHQQGAA